MGVSIPGREDLNHRDMSEMRRKEELHSEAQRGMRRREED
jgi:hypothetical protein